MKHIHNENTKEFNFDILIMTDFSLSQKNPAPGDTDSGYMATRHYHQKKQRDNVVRVVPSGQNALPLQLLSFSFPVIHENKDSCCDTLKQVLQLKPAEHQWQKEHNVLGVSFIYFYECNWYHDYRQLVM